MDEVGGGQEEAGFTGAIHEDYVHNTFLGLVAFSKEELA